LLNLDKPLLRKANILIALHSAMAEPNPNSNKLLGKLICYLEGPEKQKRISAELPKSFEVDGDPTGNRTRVSGVRDTGPER
jgi:hypothetical protein